MSEHGKHNEACVGVCGGMGRCEMGAGRASAERDGEDDSEMQFEDGE